jgi:hypothetical protein
MIPESMYVVPTYLSYLFISICLTILVARTLHKNGRQFLIEAFGGNKELADSVNHLLVVGFYLINFGYVSLMLKLGIYPQRLSESIEVLSSKIGMVLLVLGGMHFFNLAVFSNMRKKGLLENTRPPVTPTERLTAVPGI